MLKKLGLRPVHLFIAVILLAVGLMVYQCRKPQPAPAPQVVPSAPPQQMSPGDPTPDERELERTRDSLDRIPV